MKITYAVPRYLPHLGGIENHVAALATRAASNGHEVRVLTQQEGASAPDREIADGVAIERFASSLGMRGQGLSPRLWHAVRQLDDTIDVLHVHNVHAASTLGVLTAARAGRIVVTPHYLGSGEGRRNRAMHRLYDPRLGQVLRKASALVCVSRAEASELIRDLGVSAQRVHVIPNGVDSVALLAAEPANAAGRVVFVAGRLEPYKQAARVVAAMAWLPGDYSLVIAGSGPEESVLRRQADESGLHDRVRLVGKLNAGEMARWYRRTSVVVSMSRRECFGMTLAEALAARCAVVASDIPAHREVIEDAGWDRDLLVPIDASASDLAAAIARASDALAGFEPKVTTWDDVANATLELYRSVRVPTLIGAP